jgi:hypothetical protein
MMPDTLAGARLKGQQWQKCGRHSKTLADALTFARSALSGGMLAAMAEYDAARLPQQGARLKRSTSPKRAQKHGECS